MSLTCLFASAKIPIQGGVEVVYADFPPPFQSWREENHSIFHC